MTTLPFIWLGSKRAAKRGVDEKAAGLDYAAKMNLPVPAGAVLLDEFYQLLLEAEIIYVENGRFRYHDPTEIYEALYTAVHLPKLNKPAIIRTTYSSIENQPDLLPTAIKLNINMLDATQLSNSLCELWSLVGNHKNVRRDLLIQEMITPQIIGSAQISESNPVNQIIITQNRTQQPIAKNYQLPKLSTWQRSTPDLPPFAQRLQKLLRGTRNAFGKGNRQIEWMDDGQVCWLLQIRITE